MSPVASSSKKKKSKTPEVKYSTKDLLKKIDDLSLELDSIKHENESLKERLRLISNKILSNTDMSKYKYISRSASCDEYLNISTQDYLHMIQCLSLQKVSENDYIDCNHFKLNDRLDFVLLERNVWKRNHDTIRQMYEKLTRELQQITNTSTNKRLPIKYPLDKAENKLFKERDDLKCISPILDPAKNLFKSSSVELLLDSSDRLISTPKHQFKTPLPLEPPLTQTQKSTNNFNFSEDNDDIQSSSFSFIHATERQQMASASSASRKNVSFNSDIKIRTFPMMPSCTLNLKNQNLTTITSLNETINDSNDSFTTLKESKPKSIIKAELKQTPQDTQQVPINETWCLNNQQNDNHKLPFKYATSETSANDSSSTSISDPRENISSNKKLSGETPLRDIEKTLKMVIIKELSLDKVNDTNWKLFAKLVNIKETEIEEWIQLRLQYPMARVLSFWSTSSHATVRALYNHLSSPLFLSNFSTLTKRIEAFYDVHK